MHDESASLTHGEPPRVDVVVVNWNSGALLAQCIRSIERVVPRGYAIERVTVVDNASRDGSANVASTLALDVIRNASNVGFGAACNAGARTGNADWILFLNPDARIDDDSLGASLPRYAERSDVWVMGIALVDEHGRVQRTCCRAPTPLRMLARAIGLDRIAPSAGYVMSEWAHDETRLVDHVIGAFYLIRRATFERVGGFDERFFVYLEDLDLSMRVRAAGGRCLFVADAHAHHVGGGTTRSIPATRLFYSVRSRLQFASKHFGRAASAAIWLVSLTLEPLVRTLRGAAHGSASEIREVLRGYAQLVRWLVRQGVR